MMGMKHSFSLGIPTPRGARLLTGVKSYQFRTIDWIARKAEANQDLMWEVVGRIEAILAIEP